MYSLQFQAEIDALLTSLGVIFTVGINFLQNLSDFLT
jgi:hypothetical protein